MGLSRSERLSLRNSVGIEGISGAGQRPVAQALASVLDMVVIPTGEELRVLALEAARRDLFESGRRGRVRLSREGEARLTGWLTAESSRLRFIYNDEPDRTARLYVGKLNMTQVDHVNPDDLGKRSIIDFGSSLIYKNKSLRTILETSWQKTAIAFGGVVATGKLLEKFLPGAAIVVLKADPFAIAGRRLWHQVPAKNTLDEHVAYTLLHNYRNRKNGLESHPWGALYIDTSPYLIDPGGIDTVTLKIRDYLSRRLVSKRI